MMRVLGKGPSRLTPQLCHQCQDYASQYLGGTEIELSMLFADVRGSTPMAEKLGPVQFSRLISRFFATASDLLIRHRAMVDRLAGDQATGLFVPGFAGSNHREQALITAQELLHATGHHRAEGPWIPVGIGIHTGVAFVGSVGSEGSATDITVLGDPANVAARLCSAAAAGEILVSREAAQGIDTQRMEHRELDLKGKSQRVSVFVWRQLTETSAAAS